MQVKLTILKLALVKIINVLLCLPRYSYFNNTYAFLRLLSCKHYLQGWFIEYEILQSYMISY